MHAPTFMYLLLKKKFDVGTESEICNGQNSQKLPLSGGVDRTPTAETVDSGSTPDRVKPKTIKISIFRLPA